MHSRLILPIIAVSSMVAPGAAGETAVAPSYDQECVDLVECSMSLPSTINEAIFQSEGSHDAKNDADDGAIGGILLFVAISVFATGSVLDFVRLSRIARIPRKE